MFFKIFLLLFALFFAACENNKPVKKLDAKKLIVEKCAACHNLDMPPVLYKEEKAPPMMAVAFHVANFIQPNDESQRIAKSIEFVVDYVFYPSLQKSFCDKESLKTYGLMPSQKENVTQEELQAIAKYMFEHFTQKNLQEAQATQEKLNAMPEGEKIALKYKCVGCHKINQDLVGPSFEKIAVAYKNTPESIKNSIQNGSRKKWESSRGVSMPAFHQIKEEELEILTGWILKP